MTSETITDGMQITVDGIEYTLELDALCKYADFWFVVRDGEKVFTIEHTKKWGWVGTFNTTGQAGAEWAMSKNTTLIERIRKMAAAREENHAMREF